jgi:hypothetical protein
LEGDGAGVTDDAGAARGGKRLISWRSQAILTSEGRPLGECRFKTFGAFFEVTKLTSTFILAILMGRHGGGEPDE